MKECIYLHFYILNSQVEYLDILLLLLKLYFGFFIMVNKVIIVHYALSPKTAHKFVSYLEEEAVKTYT